jgi:glycosyltransferase involved in cell wall biosynthesis
MARIAILHELLGRSRGGIEAWIYHVSEELLKQGHDVTLFNLQKVTPSDAAPDGVRIVILNGQKRIIAIDFYRQVICLRKQFKKELYKYDGVWARSFTMAWAASKVLGKNKVIYVNAAPYSFYGQVSYRERLNKSHGILGFLKVVSSEISVRIAYLLERQAILRCKNVFLSNARMKETLTFFKIENSKSNYCVIPAGVNSLRFIPSGIDLKIDNTLRIISVCRLAPDKNLQCVIKAVQLLSVDNIPFQLTIVGEGYYESELKKLVSELNIENMVVFAGRQENIEEWYRKNQVFVLPSLYEGFGSVYVEAMSCGLPCIAISNKSGKYSVAADEIIDTEINGYLMLENDPHELSKYLLKLYENSNMVLEFSRNARNKAELIFSWSNTVEKLLRL